GARHLRGLRDSGGRAASIASGADPVQDPGASRRSRIDRGTVVCGVPGEQLAARRGAQALPDAARPSEIRRIGGQRPRVFGERGIGPMGRGETMRGSVGRRAVPLLAVLIIGLQAHGARAADLMDLYAKARASDPTILSARAEQMIADESLREAKAAYKPTLNASGQTTKIYQAITKSDKAFFYHEGT